MIEYTFEFRPVNIELLDAEMRAALGDVFAGLSTRPGALIVLTADEVEQRAIEAVLAAHNPADLTAAQQTALDTKTAAATLASVIEGRIAWYEDPAHAVMDTESAVAFTAQLQVDLAVLLRYIAGRIEL